jgi:hypothetical protein
MAWVWTVVAGLALLALVILVVALVVGRRARTRRLKERFGPEYERMAAAGGSAAADQELAERERLHDQLDIRALTATAREEFAQRWRAVQTGFVDDPADALSEADRLVIEVMRMRGYPVDDFDRRAANISVDHPTVVEDYRAAHAVSHARPGEQVGTEARRHAFVHYRSLFDTLLASEHPADIEPAPAQYARAHGADTIVTTHDY